MIQKLVLLESKYFYKVGIWPLGGSTFGYPSVNNKTAEFLFLLFFLKVSIPVYNPSHKLVHPPNYKASTLSLANFYPFLSILVKAKASTAELS